MKSKHLFISYNKLLVAVGLFTSCQMTKQLVKPKPEHFPIEQLPNELQAEVIRMLETKELRSLARVSKTFANLIQEKVRQQHNNDKNAYVIKVNSKVDFRKERDWIVFCGIIYCGLYCDSMDHKHLFSLLLLPTLQSLTLVNERGETIPDIKLDLRKRSIHNGELRLSLWKKLFLKKAPIHRELSLLNKLSTETKNNLMTLDLSRNQISAITALASLTKLERLNLDHNQINDITALSSLTKLERLNLDNNQISAITALSSLTKLEGLDLDNNQISDITALSSLTKLKRLYLDNNQISDITALANLTRLEELYLSRNQISGITALASLTALKKLHLDDNQISGITAFRNLTNLERLYLDHNNISDIVLAFSNLPGLQRKRSGYHQFSNSYYYSALGNKHYFARW